MVRGFTAEWSDSDENETTHLHRRLLQRIETKTAQVGVIGLGYVGLPLLQAAYVAGLPVIGFDIDAGKIDRLNRGRSYLRHIGDEKIQNMLESRAARFTRDFAKLSEADAILISVPTPLTPHRTPDLLCVEQTAQMVSQHLRPGQLIVLVSTTYPGTTREVVKPILEQSGLQSDRDFFLGYSPEREDPGNQAFDSGSTPRVVSGDGPLALELTRVLYDRFVISTVPVSSTDVAEAVKLIENIFRCVNIALVNELKVIFEAMKIDIWEVIEAAKTKPFGYMPFYPGPGLGGHCIPIDPFYLTWKAREYGVSTRFIELAGEVNTAMPLRIVQRIREELDYRLARGLTGARILVVGIAYKRNIDDTRESPALAIIDELERLGAIVDYHDPFVPEITVTRRHPGLAGRRAIPWGLDVLRRYQCAVIVTDHGDVNYQELVSAVPLVIDTRNATSAVVGDRDHIVRA